MRPKINLPYVNISLCLKIEFKNTNENLVPLKQVGTLGLNTAFHKTKNPLNPKFPSFCSMFSLQKIPNHSREKTPQLNLLIKKPYNFMFGNIANQNCLS